VSVREAIRREQRKLDDAWNEKYPQGKFYIIVTKDDKLRYGCLSHRPTRTLHIKWQVGGYYISKRFAKSHYTTNDPNKLITKLEKLGIPFSEQRTEE
jgi:hypothetical protein